MYTKHVQPSTLELLSAVIVKFKVSWDVNALSLGKKFPDVSTAPHTFFLHTYAFVLDIVGTMYHLVIYMSNKINNVVLMSKFIQHLC
jgi:hypothetical protein